MLLMEPHNKKSKYHKNHYYVFRIDGVEIGEHRAIFTPFKGKNVILNFEPFWIEVYEGDELIMAVNSNGLFKFEHFRSRGWGEKNEDGFWEETFNSYTDTKPFGSSAISIDVEFFGFKHLYGLPEHATSLVLRST